MDIRKLVGANVRRYRLSANLSQEAVAVRMDADRAFVSQIERGGQNVTLLTVHHLAEALGVRPVDLFDESVESDERAIEPRPVEPGGA
ncbi:MAG: helix-turn-helix transcriptional regulator [Sphingorhabdus sp.]|uniref:helix-turn-helix domain-containing protein n=1 Tax=Sphingomonadales TaxID=204457 RepID=UPI0032B7F0D8